MAKYKSGDRVEIIEPYYGFEPYKAGDIFTVLSVDEDELDEAYDVIITREHEGNDDYLLFAAEVTHYAEPPKDYPEGYDEPVVDEDLVHLSDSDVSMYRDIVASLSQAIADKATQMGADKPRVMPDKEIKATEFLVDDKKLAEHLFTYGQPGHPHAIHTPGKRSPSDDVKAPAHYTSSGIEPIKYMADKLPMYEDSFTGFCVGNTIKYVSRAPLKGKLLEDLKKARQYLDFAIEHEENKQD